MLTSLARSQQRHRADSAGALTSPCYVETKRPPHRGHRMKLQGKSFKMTIHLNCLIPKNGELNDPCHMLIPITEKMWMTVLKANTCIRISSFEHWKYFVKPSMASKSVQGAECSEPKSNNRDIQKWMVKIMEMGLFWGENHSLRIQAMSN